MLHVCPRQVREVGHAPMVMSHHTSSCASARHACASARHACARYACAATHAMNTPLTLSLAASPAWRHVCSCQFEFKVHVRQVVDTVSHCLHTDSLNTTSTKRTILHDRRRNTQQTACGRSIERCGGCKVVTKVPRSEKGTSGAAAVGNAPFTPPPSP